MPLARRGWPGLGRVEKKVTPPGAGRAAERGVPTRATVTSRGSLSGAFCLSWRKECALRCTSSWSLPWRRDKGGQRRK